MLSGRGIQLDKILNTGGLAVQNTASDVGGDVFYCNGITRVLDPRHVCVAIAAAADAESHPSAIHHTAVGRHIVR